MFSWNATDSPDARCRGTITHRHDVVYVFSDNTCELFAVSVPSGELSWRVADLCPESTERSYTPITWLYDDTVMLISTARRIVTVRASDGVVLMSYGPLSVPASLLPPISSRIDNKFIFHTGNDTVFKLDVETGQVVWSTLLTSNPVSTDLPAPPTVDDEGSIYVPTYTGIVYKLRSNGVVVWNTSATLQFSATQSAPILINSSHILVTSGYSVLRFFVVQTSDGKITQIYADQNGGFASTEVLSQLYWNKNVLYAVTSRGEVGAWDTTDLTGLRFLWRQVQPGPPQYSFRSPPSIAKDGTIIVASSVDSAASVTLMALGCEDGTRLYRDGVQCVCDFGMELLDGSCIECLSNQFSNDTSERCQVCNAGTVPNEDQSGCSSCPSNTFSHEGDETCSPCSEEPENAQCFVPVAVPVSTPAVSSPVRSPTNNITSGAASVIIAPIVFLLLSSNFCVCFLAWP